MIFKQYYLGCLAHASYLMGDTESGTAVVVDPQRDVDQYLDDAARAGLEIGHVFLTHFHADFVAGHLELRDRTGAAIHLGARASAEYDFIPMKDGDTLSIGSIKLEVMETPGHSPESICILVFDRERGQRPYAVLTGDTLFIGDVGRPDLRASFGWTADQLGGMLYDSLYTKLIHLPDETLIYPAHGAGSLCGKNISKETVSTVGEQKKYNYALRSMSRDDFVRIVTADQPEAPDYFTYDAVLNTKERPVLHTSLKRTLKPLKLELFLQIISGGAQVLDVRDPADYAGAHFKNSMNIGLGGNYATWAGTLFGREKDILIIANPGREVDANVRLGRIGFDHIAGYLEGGMKALEDRPDLVQTSGRITAPALREMLESPEPPFVLDVRTDGERQQRWINGSHHIPLQQLGKRIREVPADRLVVVYCASGYRSSIAASLLERHGITDVADLMGGIVAYRG